MRKRETRQTPFRDQSRVTLAASPMETLQALSLPPDQGTAQNRTTPIYRPDRFFQSLSKSPEKRKIQAADSNQEREILAPIPQKSLQGTGFLSQQTTRQNRVRLGGAFQDYKSMRAPSLNRKMENFNQITKASLQALSIPLNQSLDLNSPESSRKIRLAPRAGQYFSGLNSSQQQSINHVGIQPNDSLIVPGLFSEQSTNQAGTRIIPISERSLQAFSLPLELSTNIGSSTNQRAIENQRNIRQRTKTTDKEQNRNLKWPKL
ncbi:hypothetical protein [Ascidiimonas sp. W6]|uniref:hypothetical protein n=1 Tax=Ascidiimonas meishanensis TaxID=3128903 RepID=UPI0030EC5E08